MTQLGGAARRSQGFYSHSLTVQLVEGYGQVSVSDQASGKALPKVYVKVFARLRDQSVAFYKDGYTDLRGRFDYASLSTDQLGEVERFAILVMSEKNGALVREAEPPRR